MEVSAEGVITKMCGKRQTGVFYYVMRLAEHGEIFSLIKHTERFSEKLARTFFRKLIFGKKQFLNSFTGIERLHIKDIVHRDIKVENLLLDSKI
jgi:serine/threonine protein kinase